MAMKKKEGGWMEVFYFYFRETRSSKNKLVPVCMKNRE